MNHTGNTQAAAAARRAELLAESADRQRVRRLRPLMARKGWRWDAWYTAWVPVRKAER